MIAERVLGMAQLDQKFMASNTAVVAPIRRRFKLNCCVNFYVYVVRLLIVMKTESLKRMEEISFIRVAVDGDLLIAEACTH